MCEFIAKFHLWNNLGLICDIYMYVYRERTSTPRVVGMCADILVVVVVVGGWLVDFDVIVATLIDI